MIVKKQLHPLVWAFFMSCSLGIVSCVDSKYDLDKDIDMTVNVGGEYLTIPAGGTEQALLSTIIEVEKDDMLLIYGSGALGSTILKVARLLCDHIIVADIMDDKLELARQNGAKYTINPLKEDLTEK